MTLNGKNKWNGPVLSICRVGMNIDSKKKTIKKTEESIMYLMNEAY